MSDICLLFILIFQSISCRHIMLSSCLPTQIYILLLCRRISSLQNRSLISNAVVLMDTMKFTYDCYNFLNNWSTLHYIPMFNISLWGFIIFTMYVSHMYKLGRIFFWYDVLLNALCVNLLHNWILVSHFVHILWHTMYVMYMCYIYDTYTWVSIVTN